MFEVGNFTIRPLIAKDIRSRTGRVRQQQLCRTILKARAYKYEKLQHTLI